MEFTVAKEDLSSLDCGGGIRQLTSSITIDSTKALHLQRAALIYEYLASHFSHIVSHEWLEGIADELRDLLEELGDGGDKREHD